MRRLALLILMVAGASWPAEAFSQPGLRLIQHPLKDGRLQEWALQISLKSGFSDQMKSKASVPWISLKATADPIESSTMSETQLTG